MVRTAGTRQPARRPSVGSVASQAKAETEAQFQRAVIELATVCGYAIYHTHDSRRSNPGFPDLTMTRNGRIIFAELKTAKGRTTPEQRGWMMALSLNPAVEVYLWRPADWDTIITTLLGESNHP